MPADVLAAKTKKQKRKENKATASNKWVAPETATGAIRSALPFW